MKTIEHGTALKMKHALPIAALSIALALAAQGQTVYPGNGATGFGGSVGNGNITISDSLSGMTITLNNSGGLGNDLVLYLDTQPGGFADTSQFSDNGDGGRTAISGFNSGNPSRALATFSAGFGADYAISIENSFIGVFGLAAGGNNSLNFLFGQSQSGPGPYSITMTPAQMNQIGLTLGTGQTFYFVGSLISESAYRANETIGPSVTVPDGPGSAPNSGFNGTQTFTSDLAYMLVPEPATATLIGLGLAGASILRRRRV
jgi:hypothetical protein